MSDSIMAWHFTNGGKLRNGLAVPALGQWLEHDGPAVLCESGLHASKRVLDALQYAPGGTLHRVECREIVAEERDKLVCRRRRIVATIPAEAYDPVLRAFARHCAVSVLHLWRPPAVVVRWLETGDESIRAAARAAASDAARAAACDAARAAARAAACDAARAAAWDAASDTAWAAAWAAASDTAWDAAWDATRAAARDALAGDLERRTLEIVS